MSKDTTKTLHTLDKIVAKIVEDRDAEIARLTAELAAARAVPADVEAAIGELEHYAFESGHGYGVADMAKMRRHADIRVTSRDNLRVTIARAIAEARQPSTVGGLLATAPVVVDSDDSAAVSLIVAPRWAVRMDDGDEIRWCDSEHDARQNFAQHVAHDRHDHAPDPATRSPLGAAPPTGLHPDGCHTVDCPSHRGEMP